MNTAQYRAPGREHIPIYPRGFIAIRIIQLVLSILILALAAYSVALLAYDGNSFILAVALMTFITSIYHLVARFNAPAIYNYWATLGLDIFFVVMWLASFALLASRVSALFVAYGPSTYSSYYDYYYGSSYSYGLSSTQLIWLACQAAAASLGGVQFIIYLVGLIIHSVRLHRHRAAGLHCMPGVPPTPPAPAGTTTLPGGVPAPMNMNAYGPNGPGEKTATPAPMYAPYPHPPQQPVPAYHPHPGQLHQQYPPQQHQQPGYPEQQQGGYQMQVPVAVQQQHQPQGQGGYYPDPSQSPAPPQSAGGEYGARGSPGVQGQGPSQLPAN